MQYSSLQSFGQEGHLGQALRRLLLDENSRIVENVLTYVGLDQEDEAMAIIDEAVAGNMAARYIVGQAILGTGRASYGRQLVRSAVDAGFPRPR